MIKPEEELRARLKAEMDAEIEKMLEEAGDQGIITLSEIEQVVQEAGQRIQQRLMERLVANAVKEQDLASSNCLKCGGKLRSKGRKTRWVITTSGEVEIKRGHYYCEACKEGVFPPG